MKNIYFNINKATLKTLLALVVFAMLLSSCKKDDDEGGPITITNVYLQDAESSVTDRAVDFARQGQLIRVEGSGFAGLKRVYINGLKTYFNPVYVSDGSMLVSIPGTTPIVDAEPDVRNTIRFENDNYNYVYTIEIRAAAPSITSISNTLPLAGETITVYGDGLLEVNRVVFPGNIEVTTGIVSDEDGEFFTVTVPDGVSTEGGSLLIECANGGAYSPAYFNFHAGVILNFDGAGTQGSWGEETGMITPDDLLSTSVGIGNLSHGIYVPHRPSRIASFDAGAVRCSEVWTAGNGVDDWRGQLTPYIPVTTPASQVAFQFDIYVPTEWAGSGYLKILLANGFSGGDWSGYLYNYIPWLVDGEIVPFKTEGWTTVTIPFSEFYGFSDAEYTFEDVLLMRESYDNSADNKYKNCGIWIENNDFTMENITGNSDDSETEFLSSSFSLDVYTDNWRVVSLVTPVYSDFPETE